jgi:hypothetical protein
MHVFTVHSSVKAETFLRSDLPRTNNLRICLERRLYATNSTVQQAQIGL